jgi:hypothetical protein
MTLEDELIGMIEKEVAKCCNTNLPTLSEFVKTDEGKQTATRMIYEYCVNNGVSVQSAMAHIDTEL